MYPRSLYMNEKPKCKNFLCYRCGQLMSDEETFYRITKCTKKESYIKYGTFRIICEKCLVERFE